MRRTPGEQLSQAIREAADAAADRNEPIWAVTLDSFASCLFCDAEQLRGVLAVTLADRYEWRVVDTDRDGIRCVVLEPPREHFAIAESFMPCFMAALRANGCHGIYRESGTERSYRF